MNVCARASDVFECVLTCVVVFVRSRVGDTHIYHTRSLVYMSEWCSVFVRYIQIKPHRLCGLIYHNTVP